MPPRKNSSVPAPNPENLLMIVGQLLEATKVATEGIKSLSIETRSNATAIITAAKTLEMVEETVNQLNKLVRTNADNLVYRVDNLSYKMDANSQLIRDLEDAGADLKKEASALKDQIDGLGQHNTRISTVSNTLWYIVIFVAWLITTGIALFAALKGK